MTSRDALRWSLLALALVLPISIAGTNAGLVLVTAALLWHRLSGNSLDWKRTMNPAAGCLWLYAAVAVASSLAGVDPANSFRGLHKDLHKLWAFYALLLAFAATEDRTESALKSGFALIAAIGIGQTLTQRSPIDHGWIRAHGFVHPVTFGGQMCLGALGAFCVLGGETRGKAGDLVVGLLTVAALILSQTRGAFIGMVAGFTILCVFRGSLRRWAVWAALAALIGLVILELLPTHRSLIVSVYTEGTALSGPQRNAHLARLGIWEVSWRIFLDHPWTGVGPGNFRSVFAKYASGTIGDEAVWGSAHNLYLHQLAERGLAGFTALMALLTAFVFRAWRRARANPDARRLWALTATAAFLIMNVTETAFQNELAATLFLFLWTRAEAVSARNL